MSSNTRCSGLSRQRGQVAGRNYPPTNKNTLIRALTEEWDKLPQQLLDNVVQSMADGPKNLEQPTLNHVQSATMTSAILADYTCALQGTNRGSGPDMEAIQNYVGSLKQLLLNADQHYLAGKLPLGDHLGKALHGVEEYHQCNVDPLKFHASH
ncbi:15-hydroxyprostaglandin dehydrogenase [Trichonephila clavipes]|uniref:15-hydroxyprostaglandin dehydrogenase n=1 Tax=Trichonephila clavipes TaxID=2585209 RepID=A0A8X6T703_TRICX|nr:15-hydroxyprostaglandin dehydrogenase [Trichonephila clavipes]